MEQFLTRAIRERNVSLSAYLPNRPTFVEFNVIHPKTDLFVGKLRPLAQHFEQITPGATAAITSGKLTHIRISGTSSAATKLIARLIRAAGGEIRR